MNTSRRPALRLTLALTLLASLSFGKTLDDFKVQEIPDTKLSLLVPSALPEPETLEMDAEDKDLFPKGLNYYFPGESDGMFSMLTVLKTTKEDLDEDFLKAFTESYLEARGEDKDMKYVVKLREQGTIGAFRGQHFSATVETDDIKMEEQGMVLIGEKEILVYLVSADTADKAAITEKKKAFDVLRYAGKSWVKVKDIEFKK